MVHLSAKWMWLGSVLCVGIIACQPAPAPPPTATPSTPAQSTIAPTPEPVLTGLCGSNACPTPRSPYDVTVQTTPTPMAFLRPTTFTVQIKDPRGVSLQDVSVLLFATHTEDIHEDVGPVQADHVADSIFRGQLILRKKGNYNVIATIHGPSGEGEHVFHLDTEY